MKYISTVLDTFIHTQFILLVHIIKALVRMTSTRNNILEVFNSSTILQIVITIFNADTIRL